MVYEVGKFRNEYISSQNTSSASYEGIPFSSLNKMLEYVYKYTIYNDRQWVTNIGGYN